jgi:catechol 2,3-dioxygenase-like lactoylglutathione lyase family enzyme
MEKPLKIEWIILITDSFSESRKFYKDILNMEIVREEPGEEFTQFKLENCYLAIYGRREAEKLVGKEIAKHAGGAIYSFAESDNIDRDFSDLTQKGVRFIREPETQPWGQRTAYFTDPDGNIWEIQQWMNK